MPAPAQKQQAQQPAPQPQPAQPQAAQPQQPTQAQQNWTWCLNPGKQFPADTSIKGCDAVIAEVSTPSHGVGYEISYALRLRKPVLCCYKEGVPVSKMILGNDSPGLAVQSYQDEREALELIDKFLSGLGQ